MKGMQTATRFLIAISAALTFLPAFASPAWAVKRCPPLVVGDGNVVECKVANYGTTPDTNVKITLYDGAGIAVKTCGPTSIPAKGSVFCNRDFNDLEDIGCEVTGEGASARVSLIVFISAFSSSTGAAVECR
jgi:hypothetical protein